MSRSYSPYKTDFILQSPTIPHNDPYTPLPSERKAEIYYLKVEKDDQPIHDESPHRSFTPTIDTFHPSSNGAAEMYHLKVADDMPHHRSSPELVNSNRMRAASPLLLPSHLDSSGHGAEMYYLRVDNDRTQPIPSISGNHQQSPRLIDSVRHEEPHDQQGATIYVLTTINEENQENLPPPRRPRTPSPPIRPTTKQQPVSYEILDDTTKRDVPTKQRLFPTALADASSNIRYVPLTQSKASESIQRSMNKYRFSGN